MYLTLLVIEGCLKLPVKRPDAKLNTASKSSPSVCFPEPSIEIEKMDSLSESFGEMIVDEGNPFEKYRFEYFPISKWSTFVFKLYWRN